jgi:hypothetical protein
MAKKTILTILLTLLSFVSLVSPARAQSADLLIRLEEPATPTNIKDIELKFVALDIEGRDITVKCLKKGPSESSLSQFGSNINLSAGGNSSHCSLSSAINDNGSYQFQVSATADGETVYSQIVDLDYKTSSPGTPIDYRKEKINNCDFKIHFKSADDSNKTVKVELYRSSDSAFSANNDSLVSSVDIGSNQEKDIYNSVPDCSKNYYYALRAFDNAGNGSGLVGDNITITTTSNTTTTTSSTNNLVPTTTAGAIPVGGSNISPEGTQPNESELNSNNQGETGQVLGVEEVKKTSFFARHKIISTLIIVAVLVIIAYAFKKIKKGRKSNYR